MAIIRYQSENCRNRSFVLLLFFPDAMASPLCSRHRVFLFSRERFSVSLAALRGFFLRFSE
nr:MAG TPA: hypothetical protein [Caudoviricetes sp.]